ncbi:ycf20-like protein isoform X1 [Cryptomeria japonica]|uniref:ycf20-like protein isoform X1 n=2 Tax=Cryptomeria japonica TaxID=3369 RepID=UPI0025AD03A7|nr:ycf20-like protein isoform X1 [Cryptomeria japonica]
MKVLNNMAIKITQSLVRNPDPLRYPSPSVAESTVCSWNSRKANSTWKGFIHFRIASTPPFRNKGDSSKRGARQVSFVLDTGANSDRNEGTVNEDIPRTGLGSTRLGRIIQASGSRLLNKINGARSNFPMKTFLLLLGYYTANALATIIGQTGDWDVLVAGIVVAAIEGIGILMYRNPIPIRKLQSLVVMVNFWKAGVCLGLFVDAFKLGS